MTANKLVDAWCGQGQSSLRVRDVKTLDPSREDCEPVIVDMLLEGVLREDFHFTPYSTISYLLPGPKAGLMHSGKRFYMHLKANLFGWRWFTYNDFSTYYDFSIDDDDVSVLDVIFGDVYVSFTLASFP